MMNNTNRIRVVSISIIALAVVGYILVKLLLLPATEQMRTSKKTLADYNNLFTNEAQAKLQILATVETSTRNPVSNYAFDSRYHVKVFKIDLANSGTLDQLLTEKKEHSDRISGFVNPMVHNSYFEMSYMTGKPGPASKINFRLEGDSIQTTGKNDSLVCYYLKIGTFGIGYNDDPGNDIWGSAANEGPIPISIGFIKKGKFIYFILLHVDQGSQVMPHQVLWDMFKK
jgi:hypothetical protein